MKRMLIVVFTLLMGGVALAQSGTTPGASLEQRLDRIEQAIKRLDGKLATRADRGMMDACREMMGGGMMGGMKGQGGPHGSPNSQWQETPGR